MRAATIIAPNSVAVIDRPEPDLGPGDVMVAPVYVGLCGTDLELLDGSMPYFAQGRAVLPLQPGHEVAGVVVTSHDASVPAGTRVVIDPVVGCGGCPNCAEARAIHCVNRREMGVRGGMDGGAAERVVVPAANVHPVPAGVPLRAAVLTEPGVTPLNALRRIGKLGGNALVVGDGTLGAIAAQLLLARGLSVDVLVRSKRRADLIGELGAVPCAAACDSEYSVVVEAAGSAEALRSGLRAVASGGSLALLGLQGGDLDGLDVDAIVLKDVSVYGVLNGPGLYEAMLDEIAKGNVRTEGLIDREFPLEEAPAAFAWLASEERGRPKVLLRVGGMEVEA